MPSQLSIRILSSEVPLDGSFVLVAGLLPRIDFGLQKFSTGNAPIQALPAEDYVTITTLDGELARKLEPRATAPHRRLRIIRTLAAAGVPRITTATLPRACRAMGCGRIYCGSALRKPAPGWA